jgi:hypothetical protein
MADEVQQPIPAPPGDSTTAAMTDLVKNVQAAMQQLQTKMKEDSEALISKCNLVTPLGGGFRDYNELGYILQYIRSDKDLRRAVVEFVKAEVDKRKGTTTVAPSGTAATPKTA